MSRKDALFLGNLSVRCPNCKEMTALSLGLNGQGQAACCEDKYGKIWWIGLCNSHGCGQAVLVQGFLGDVIYPFPLPSSTDEHVPKNLSEDLDEAKMCFSVQCFRACAVMARRCIQQACLMKGCKNSTLVRQIEELKQAGHMTKDIEEWVTVVRWVGNDAAHPSGQVVSRADAEDCLKLAEQFLHVLFVTPAVAKSRRTHRGK